VFVGFALCAPLALFKKLDHLKVTSTLSLLLVLFLVAIVVGYSAPGSVLDACEGGDVCARYEILALD
jgi:amino acid permease